MKAEGNILEKITKKNLKWFGHVLRIGDERWPKWHQMAEGNKVDKNNVETKCGNGGTAEMTSDWRCSEQEDDGSCIILKKIYIMKIKKIEIYLLVIKTVKRLSE